MLNRLKLMRFYGCGPIDRISSDGGKLWRDDMSEWLKSRGAIFLNPLDKPLHPSHLDGLENDDEIIARKKAINGGDRELARQLMKPIVSIDLRMVDHSDALIVMLDIEGRPCGTFDELFTACNQNKPTIIMCPQGVNKIYDWLYGRIPHQFFFDTWDGVKDYLDHINNDDDIDTLGKWKFFDLEEITREILMNDTSI